MNSKAAIINLIEEKLIHHSTALQSNLLELQKEIGEESKSSAGDKFETSREMMTQSINRIEENLKQVNQKLIQLKNLPTINQSQSVQLGSLVVTTKATFLFGIAFGKLQGTNDKIYALSLNSPLGKAFYGKSSGDSIYVNQNTYHIQSIT